MEQSELSAELLHPGQHFKVLSLKVSATWDAYLALLTDDFHSKRLITVEITNRTLSISFFLMLSQTVSPVN